MDAGGRKKILFVITKSNWGGAQRYVFDVATALSKGKYEVVVACGGTGKEDAKPGKLWHLLSNAGIKTILVPSFMRDISFVKEIRAFFELISIIKKERPDIIHLNSSKSAGLGALAARLTQVKKIVYTIHGLAVHEKRSLPATWIIRILSWITILLTTDVIVIDNRDAEAVNSWIAVAPEKTHYIPNGIPEIQFTSKEDSRTVISGHIPKHLQDNAGISRGIWIGTISELTANKGLTYFIEAFGLLSKKQKNVYGFIIGNGEELTALKELALRQNVADRIFFTDFIDNAAVHIKAFDIFILSSVKEGLPYVILEAGLAGLPVVATNVGGIPDIIEDMKSGIIVKPRDPRDIAKALEFLITNPDRTTLFQANLQKRISEQYSLVGMVEKTEMVYHAA